MKLLNCNNLILGPDAAEIGVRSKSKVAVLCAAKNSVYHGIPGLDVYDQERDAFTFDGGMPVIAHPPCRLWSAYCAHQAKSPDPEKEKSLGLWCVGQVMRWGGVLEQPAHSRLFEAANLPKPSAGRYGVMISQLPTKKPLRLTGFSIEIPQFWFGDTREKSTWLYFSRLAPRDIPEIPFRLKPQGGDRRTWQLMSGSNGERSRTPEAFAHWLIECARRVKEPCL